MASTLNLGAVKTPGVYIDELSLFPPSVAQVDTAVPAFIGPTRMHLKDGKTVLNIPTRVKSIAEFRAWFGGGPDRNLTVVLDPLNGVESVTANAAFYLYDSLLMYFGNGGEKCYVVSTGQYAAGPPTAASYTAALDGLRKYDEPTLVVLPDAVSLTAAGALASVQQAALDHCQGLQDRFAVLDVQVTDPNTADLKDSDILAFRNGVTNHLNYGAAYYPYLKTSLPLTISFASLTLQKPQGTFKTLDSLLDPGPNHDLAVAAKNLVADFKLLSAAGSALAELATYPAGADKTAKRTILSDSLDVFAGTGGHTAPVFTDATTTTDYGKYKDEATPTPDGQKLIDLRTAVAALVPSGAGESPQALIDRTYAQVNDYVGGFSNKVALRLRAREDEMKTKIPVYAAVVAAAEAQGIVLPPSGAVTGAYARTDNDRGVWKAPANVGLNYVIGPTAMLTDKEQEDLNVDVNAGKSINAIRAFTGKGTLIWGARTLAGSDNEWRYVPVRRFFIMVEESVRKATGQFVFEPNDANTWVRVRAMIENFLTLQWRAGALAGIKAEHAFFVRVGLGQTMTAQDVLNGFMIVEIGMAAVRPAEFIILRFSHKMQES